MRPLARLLRLAIYTAIVLAGVTYFALEGGDVGVLKTHGADNNAWNETHVWYAEDGGSLWLEAATPTRPWLAEIRRNSEVELERDGATTLWNAAPVEGDEARANVRSLLRAKYGWADQWVELLQDTSDAVAVRLDPR